MPVRWTIGRALAALAPEIDPELCRVVAAADNVDLQLFIEGSYIWSDWALFGSGRLQPLGPNEHRRRLLVALIDRVQPGGIWRLVILPDDAGHAVPLSNDQLAELTPDSFDVKRARFDDPEKSDLILGERRHRVRVEVRDRLPVRPTFDRVKRRVEEALAQRRISWEVFDALTEEALRARFHPESKTARNTVRAVRAEPRAPQLLSPIGEAGLE